MSRHGYSDNADNLAMWRGVIASATRGKRGQSFFRALVDALDAMPEKRLVEGELQTQEGSVCALGCLGRARGMDIGGVDTTDWSALGELFDIAPQLAQEVMFVSVKPSYAQLCYCAGIVGADTETCRDNTAWTPGTFCTRADLVCLEGE